MWKAEKIELIKNVPHHGSYHFDDCYSLEINGERISNTIKDSFMSGSINSFQTHVCDYCGEEGCNPRGYLMIVKQEEKILFLPCFWLMEDEFEEYDSSDGKEPYDLNRIRNVLIKDMVNLEQFLKDQ